MDDVKSISEQADILQKFKDLLIAFFGHLIKWRGDIDELTTIRFGLEIGMPVENFLRRCVQIMVPNADSIRNRDEKFFRDNPSVFGSMSGTDTGLIYKIWTSPTTDQESKNILWQWINAFLSLSEKYVKAGGTVDEQ